jgi:hypothetical protein
MSRHLDHMALAERRRLLAEEAKAKARADAQAVEAGVAETLALGVARGEAAHAPGPDRGGRPRPSRRLTGLQWAAQHGGFTEDELAAGDRYGAAYRAVAAEPALQSCLTVPEGGGMDPARQIALAHWRAAQRDRLTRYRTLLGHPRLIAACDLVAGMELTPRQASKDGHQAATLVELLSVALGLLTREKDQP